ncbi:hypothetical protein D3C81_2132750 [compost metagenome]
MSEIVLRRAVGTAKDIFWGFIENDADLGQSLQIDRRFSSFDLAYVSIGNIKLLSQHFLR